MANWTDKTPPTFAPYVQQLPVETYVSVGMQKQQQYNEGIQRIQSQIDNVAGLDIIRDVDKQHLQSKLSSLGTNLKSVAAGDFSNFQLVNSVGGMINKIGKDPYVQNAVISTQRVRKGQQEIDSAKREGKSSIQNEKDWDTQVNSWMNDKDIKNSFRGEYVPYTDLTKKYGGVYKQLKESGYSYDIPFISNADGTPKYFTTDKKGNLVETTKDKGQVIPDMAMKRISKKGIGAYTILENFYSNTTENDKRQLRIDANYHYENATVDTFKNDIINNFALTASQLQQKQDSLKFDIAAGNISSEEKAKAQAELGRIQMTLSELPGQQTKLLTDLQDPNKLNAYKVDVYTQKFLTELARDKATEELKEEILTNPYKQSEMGMKRLDFDIKKENERINEFNIRHRWDVEKFRTLQDDKKKAAKLKEPPLIVTEPGGQRRDIETPTVIQLDDTITKLKTDIVYQEAEFLAKHGEHFNKTIIDKTLSEYRTNPGVINTEDNDVIKFIEHRIELEDEFRRKGKLKAAASALTADIDVKIDNVTKYAEGLYDEQGKEVYTAKELMDIKYRVEDYYEKYKNDPNIIEKISTAFRSSNYAPIVNVMLKKIQAKNIPELSDPDLALTSQERMYTNKLRNLAEELSSKIEPLKQEQNRIQSEYLRSKMPEYFTHKGRIDPKNKDDMRSANDIVALAINSDIGQGVSKDLFNPSILTKWRETEKVNKNLDYILRKNDDGSGELIIQHSNETPQTIPLTEKQFNKYYPKYSEKPLTTLVNDRLIESTEGTTNSYKLYDPRGATPGSKLPLIEQAGISHLVRWDVEGTPATDKTQAEYQIRLYVLDKTSGIWKDRIITNRGYITTAADLEEKLNTIGLNQVKYVLNK